MIDPVLVDLTQKALMLILILSLPVIIVAAVTGVMVSLVQAVTQVQDQTISFAVKLIAVIIALLLTGSWIGAQVLNYAMYIFDRFPVIFR